MYRIRWGRLGAQDGGSDAMDRAEASTQPSTRATQGDVRGAARQSTLEMSNKLVGTLLTAVCLIWSIVFVFFAAGTKGGYTNYHLAATFLTTYYSDMPQLTWNPTGNPSSTPQLLGTAYQCLAAANVNTGACSPTPPVTTGNVTATPYATCLNQQSSFQQCIAGLVQMSSTSVSVFQIVQPFFNSVWQCTASSFLVTDSNFMAYQMCLPLANTSVLEVMQDTYTTTMLGAFNWVLLACVAMWILTSFAVYTIYLGNDVPDIPNDTQFQQDINLAGKFSCVHVFARTGWLLTTVALAWNLCAFVFMGSASWRIGGSGNMFADNNIPMSIQTCIITLLAIIASCIYMGTELWEQIVINFAYTWHKDAPTPDGQSVTAVSVYSHPVTPADHAKYGVYTSGDGTPAIVASQYGKRSYGNNHSGKGLGIAGPLRYYMRVPPYPPATIADSDKSLASSVTQDEWLTTPLTVFAWSDALVLVDPLLAVAIVGATQDAVTAEVCVVFMTTLYGAIAHTKAQRDIYQGYTLDSMADLANVFRLKSSKSLAESDMNALFGVRIAAATGVWARVAFSLVALMSIYGRYSLPTGTDYSLIIGFAVCVYMVPALYWVAVQLTVDLRVGQEGVRFRHQFWAQLAFNYDLIIRFAFSLSVFVMYGYDVFGGKFPTLRDPLYNNLPKFALN